MCIDWYEREGEIPPIGTELEAFIYGANSVKCWAKRIVLGHASLSRRQINGIIVDSGDRQSDFVVAEKFRPLKSDRDKAIEAGFRALPQHELASMEWHDHSLRIIEKLYDAGLLRLPD